MILAMRITATITWAGIGFLILMLWRIARFYERSSGKHAASFLFLPPLLLIPGGAAWYIVTNPNFVGSVPGDTMFAIGGITLALATSLLRQAMIGER